tara:strand:+ start:228 stop:1220 length:993 start_codon:yes stop_codon:yes gene_type:complete
MMGIIFTKFIVDNYLHLLSTPLSFLLFTYVIKIWCQNELEDISDKQKDILDYMAKHYDSNKKCDEIKLGLYDNKLFSEIMNNIIKVNIEEEFKKLTDDLNDYRLSLIQSKMPEDLKDIFIEFYILIINNINDLESYVDNHQAIFIKNYSNLIYNDSLSKESINEIVFNKKSEFQLNVRRKKRTIHRQMKTYFRLLNTWIPIYNSGNNKLKIYNYPDKFKKYEMLSIYDDICSIGDLELIKLTSHVLDNLHLKKMSSGVSKEYHESKLPIPSEIFSDFSNENTKKEFFKKVKEHFNKEKFNKSKMNVFDDKFVESCTTFVNNFVINYHKNN